MCLLILLYSSPLSNHKKNSLLKNTMAFLMKEKNVSIENEQELGQAPGQRNFSNCCLSGKGRDAETSKEQPRNNSAALGQDPSSTSRYACLLSSVAQSRLTLYNPMDCSIPGFFRTLWTVPH